MAINEKKLQQITPIYDVNPKTTIFALASLICAWLILYLIYILKHDIPTDPGGYYLESAQQLAQNRFLIPTYVQGFGVNGIPYVYPPMAFYVLAVMGYLFGGVLNASLYIPGILLLIQAILMYFFMFQWKGSKQVSLWAALVLLLMPQMFSRTIFADGITTGLAGIFLLASWIMAIKTIDLSNNYRKSILSGVFVGLSILSHPAIGLFCSVSFVVLYLYSKGFTKKAMMGLFLTGIIALVVILPWLYTTISKHGIAPFLAGLSDSKSSLSVIGRENDMFGFVKSTFYYIVNKHIDGFSNTWSFIVFPFILAVVYNIIKGPRIIILLLLVGLVIMRGHPSVTMFVLAASLGLFYDRFFMTFLDSKYSQYLGKNNIQSSASINWQFLSFFAIHVFFLIMLCSRYTNRPPFDVGEQETYEWIRENSAETSTFVTESMDEKLVFFGQRTILLPILGAEWIPDPEFGNWTARNSYINNEIFQCRESECLLDIFEKYNLTPDYIIYSVSNYEERAWIEDLNVSSMFKIVFQSENFVTLRTFFNYANSSLKTP
jgi:hypothetical protein